MTKKTFEHVIKATISAKDLQVQFMWDMGIDDGDKTFNQFCKEYDWEALLNGAKFNKYVLKHMRECPEDAYVDAITNCFFRHHNEVYNAIEKKYNKFVGVMKKKEPTLTKSFTVTIKAPKADIDRIIDNINDNHKEVIIEGL